MFYKQNGIVAGILLLILFAGAIGLVSVQMDKTVNRMHYSVVEEMGEYRTELIRQDFQKTAELVESMQDYLATRGYQKEQFEELIALLIRQDNKVSRIWFETEGKRTICTDSGIRESEAGPSKERNGGLYAVIRAAGGGGIGDRYRFGSFTCLFFKLITCGEELCLYPERLRGNCRPSRRKMAGDAAPRFA